MIVQTNGKGGVVGRRPQLLFLCTGNSCRSQMAEAWARALRSADFDAHSAGTHPQGINPRAALVMAEVGLPLTGARSRSVDELAGVEVTHVVTVCDAARHSCPVFPGNVLRLHRSFDDPPALAKGAATEHEALQHFRRVRDEIDAKLQEFAAAHD